MLWTYPGPLPAPLIPRLDGFVAEGVVKMIGYATIPCNWLQIMENSHDPVHTEWLHGHLQEFVEEQRDGIKPAYAISRHHVDIAFDEFEYGIYKRRLMEGQSVEADDWKTGHPAIFPNILTTGSCGGWWRNYAMQIRVPLDDENTLQYWYQGYAPPDGVDVPRHLLDEIPSYEVPFKDANGEFMLDLLDAQDVMAWVTQGAIAKRELEKLGWTDRGVTMLRRLLAREIAKVEAGGDPMGVIRDPAKNECIEIPVEHGKNMYSDGFASRARRNQLRYYPYIKDLVALFASAGGTVGAGV
jgi:5,5'-dehydrodivanillate O-demethylase